MKHHRDGFVYGFQFLGLWLAGVVHAWVGQIVLVCNESKTKRRPSTEARAQWRNSSRGGHS